MPSSSEPMAIRNTSASSGRRLAETSAWPTGAFGREDGRAAGKRGPCKGRTLLHHRLALHIQNALEDGRSGRGADLADGGELIGVVAPGRVGRVDVLRRAHRRQLGLVGERIGLLQIADDAVADGNDSAVVTATTAPRPLTRLRGELGRRDWPSRARKTARPAARRADALSARAPRRAPTRRDVPPLHVPTIQCRAFLSPSTDWRRKIR